MNRREFIKGALVFGTGAALWPLLDLKKAEAAWQVGNEEGVKIRETHLRFKKLENRTKTDALVIHHTGEPNRDMSAAAIHRLHLRNGWSGIGYHFVIRQNGTIERGRPLHTMGAHCYGHNDHTVGINLAGNFEISWPTEQQLSSAATLLVALGRIYGLELNEDTVKGHRDFGKTLCPGQHLYDLLPDILEEAAKITAKN